MSSSHPAVPYVPLSVLTQLGQHTAGWMRGVLRVRRGELSYIPSIGAVCLPTRSLPVQSREIGREEFPLCVHTEHGHNHTRGLLHACSWTPCWSESARLLCELRNLLYKSSQIFVAVVVVCFVIVSGERQVRAKWWRVNLHVLVIVCILCKYGRNYV